MSCNCSENLKFNGLSPTYKRILWIVIAINAAMFVTEISAGFIAQSQSLKADALDFLGDSITYALSLYVIGKSLQLRTKVALLKGYSLGLLSLWVLASTLYRVMVSPTPEPLIMGSIGLMALAANLISVLLLMRYRDGDANVRSVWLCSRNDAIGNVAVMLAALAVWKTGSHWPDLVVAFLMAALFLNSALQIVRQARQEQAEAEALKGQSSCAK
ncbi:MAG: cation diffusion facilitator family transporter [Motiliproteus sp.]|nr:cation diffusion facilitator family transporter [Motiliproteus sp.]MCW9051644.1 cation diffusion facilitator family transporter [Motiliproteus sp.]